MGKESAKQKGLKVSYSSAGKRILNMSFWVGFCLNKFPYLKVTGLVDLRTFSSEILRVIQIDCVWIFKYYFSSEIPLEILKNAICIR